jgi:hypothetical protein
MSRIREELKVVPPAARLTAVVPWLAFAAVVGLVGIPEGHLAWPEYLVSTLIPLFLSVYVLLIGYVNGDARRRGMSYVLWTLLAIFIPNAIGIILYFVMREPLAGECPKCSMSLRGKFAYCPSCGGALTQTCPDCRQAVEPEWLHCPGCGKGMNAA